MARIVGNITAWDAKEKQTVTWNKNGQFFGYGEFRPETWINFEEVKHQLFRAEEKAKSRGFSSVCFENVSEENGG